MNSPNLKTHACTPHQPPTVDGWCFSQAPSVETARLLALALPGDSLSPERDAFEGLAALNKRLVDAPDDEIRQALGRQAALLEALILRYTRQALEARRPDHAALLQGVALKCQRAHLNALGALHRMNQDRRDAPQALEEVD